MITGKPLSPASTPLPSILIVGCGSIGERHLRCFLKTGRAKVHACESNPSLAEKIGRAYDVEVRTNLAEAISGRFDGVVVCTPAPSHVAIARAALQHGSHVLIEKPLSHSLEGVAELLSERDHAKRAAAVAFTQHSYPILREVGEFLRRGEFGPIRQATVLTGQCFPHFRPAYASTYYRDRSTGGGAIQDALTHSVNWVESVLGPVKSVLCDCDHLVLAGVEVEDTVHVSTRHDGAMANFSLNQFQAPNELTMQFNAAQGSVKVELHASRWGTCAQGQTEWRWQTCTPLDRDQPFIHQANAFLDLMAGGPSRLCSLEAATHTLRFCLAALQSAATGRRVDCASLS